VAENGGNNLYVRRNFPASLPFRFSAQSNEMDAQNRHAELFYLQKQIQSQTLMVIVLEDGEKIEGCIEWYDNNVIKVRGTHSGSSYFRGNSRSESGARILIYKSSIKYLYKAGENAPL
jgi:hypothetical protein